MRKKMKGKTHFAKLYKAESGESALIKNLLNWKAFDSPLFLNWWCQLSYAIKTKIPVVKKYCYLITCRTCFFLFFFFFRGFTLPLGTLVATTLVLGCLDWAIIAINVVLQRFCFQLELLIGPDMEVILKHLKIKIGCNCSNMSFKYYFLYLAALTILVGNRTFGWSQEWLNPKVTLMKRWRRNQRKVPTRTLAWMEWHWETESQ